MVAYDLHQQGQNYDCIIRKLKNYPTHWHMQGSVWIVDTNQTSVEVRDGLAKCLDQNDKLMVWRLDKEAAWSGYPEGISNWIKDRCR
ncbi:SinR family protein [Sphingobium yanoikuyae]|uniref:SinR family protein n=1 Tax=Sphingobium yanoikuyae TaxID=13690 RepID=UPI0013787D68|nr:SinR family protein [Sphingobium yanoikuyae]